MNTRPHPHQYDVAVLGGGSAGYAAARTTAAAGLHTVVIDGAKELGGLCILRGCMPTKALLHAAELLQQTREASTWGVQSPHLHFDFPTAMARKHALIQEFADYRRGQLNDGRFELIRTTARFTDPHTLALADGRSLTAAHTIIATGSTVAPPPLASLADVGCLTSDDALALPTLPQSLIVLGGGAVAVELAQCLHRFGVAVTLIQRSPRLLRDFDAPMATVLETVLRREGMTIFTDTRLLEARRDGPRKTVAFEHQGQRHDVQADDILLALGRSPNTNGIGLEAAGVRTEAGRILTDPQMRTSAPHVFAAGDCTSAHEVVHIAIQQGEVAAHNIIHPATPRSMDHRLLLNVVFTDPQLATVGLSEKAAQASGIPYRVACYPFNDHGKSLIMCETDGFVSLLANPQSGEILGGGCVGPVAGELIHEIVAAMAGRLTVSALAAMPHYHPTLAEIWTYPAEALATQLAAEPLP